MLSISIYRLNALSREDIADKVIEYLKWHPNAKPSEIADFLGVNPRIVRFVLSRLRARGILVKTERGYSLKSEALSGKEGAGLEALKNGLSKKEGVADRKAGEAIEQHQMQFNVLQKAAQLGTSNEVVKRVEHLEQRVSLLEKVVEEFKEAIKSIQQQYQSTLQKDAPRKCDFQKLVGEAIEVLKMGFEAIRIGDQHSLDSLLIDLEDILGRLKRCRAVQWEE
jgi:DNA-binding Lrp family transcriptional regulator